MSNLSVLESAHAIYLNKFSTSTELHDAFIEGLEDLIFIDPWNPCENDDAAWNPYMFSLVDTHKSSAEYQEELKLLRQSKIALKSLLLEFEKLWVEFRSDVLKLLGQYKNQEFFEEDFDEDEVLYGGLSSACVASLFLSKYQTWQSNQKYAWNVFYEQAKREVLDAANPSISLKAKNPRRQEERRLEDSLYLWMIGEGVQVERQVIAGRHRMDLWIPGVCFLELKSSQISGDDFCQALDYYSEHKKSVILIGKSLSRSASRGLDAIAKLNGDDAIVFVSWGAAKDYLSRILGLA